MEQTPLTQEDQRTWKVKMIMSKKREMTKTDFCSKKQQIENRRISVAGKEATMHVGAMNC